MRSVLQRQRAKTGGRAFGRLGQFVLNPLSLQRANDVQANCRADPATQLRKNKEPRCGNRLDGEQAGDASEHGRSVERQFSVQHRCPKL